MVANRLTLFGVFAGGCLSGAALLTSWRMGVETGAREVSQQSRASEALALPIATAHAAEPTPAATSTKPSEADSLPLPVSAKETSAPSAEPSLHTAEDGSSLADVLNGFEAKYRQELAAASDDAPAKVPAVLSAPRKEVRPAAPEPTEPVAAVATREVPVREAPSREVAVRDTALRSDLAVRVAAAVPPSPVNQDARPAAVQRPQVEVIVPAREAAEARNISVSIGDIQQNVYAGEQDPTVIARQLALAQQTAATQQVAMYQQAAMYQQMMMMQYLQLLSLSRNAPPVASPAPGHYHQANSNRRISAFPTSLTNTDNPWGFSFPPTVLAR